MKKNLGKGDGPTFQVYDRFAQVYGVKGWKCALRGIRIIDMSFGETLVRCFKNLFLPSMQT